MLWSHRCTISAATFPDLWAFLQRPHRRHHCDHLPIQPPRRPLPATPMARSESGDRYRSCCHASYQEHSSTSWRNGTTSLHRSPHLGFEMVLFARPSIIVLDCAGHGFDGEQHSATISQVLGRSDPTTAASTENRAARKADDGRRFLSWQYAQQTSRS
jgi:hypothetical protein